MKTDVRHYRAIVTKALHHLGHKHGNPPTVLVKRFLMPFVDGKLPKSKDGQRRALIAAAQIAMQQPAVTAVEALDVTPTKKTVRKRTDNFYKSWEWKRVNSKTTQPRVILGLPGFLSLQSFKPVRNKI